MTTYSQPADVTNIKFDQEIIYSDKVFRFTEITEINPIPTNRIIYKTVTGIGATHAEIVEKRNSIIVLPHISIVRSKNQYYTKERVNTFAVYGDVKYVDIYEYLKSDNEFAKFLTTPKGVAKIIRMLEFAQEQFPDLRYKERFFILIDECHKIIQEADYREDMTEVMESFFEFENKAMVSATPIPPSDPRFKEKGFQHIKVRPQTYQPVKIDLMHVNSLVNGLQTYFSENEHERYCIFFNSIIGINSIIKQLGLEDYKVFCSHESVDIQTLQNRPNVYFEVGELTRFNFFTSSFFNGLDIHSPIKPNIVILTDYGFKTHTLIDPYTDTLQIIGRFRKKSLGEIPYNKVTHINNSSAFTNPISIHEALEKISISEDVYNHIKTLMLSLNGTAHHDLFKEALNTVTPFSKLRKADDGLCYFLFDNYLDEQRVKAYYKGASTLFTAYYRTQFYDISNDRKSYEKEELLKLQNNSLRYSKEMNIKMADALLNLEDYLGLDIYHEQDFRIAKLSYVIHRAYKELGYGTIQKLNFSKTKLEKELLKLDIEQGKKSFPVINIIHRYFQLNKTYTWKSIKTKLQQLFNESNVNCLAKAKDIERYFEFISKKEGDSRVYVFTAHKLFAVDQQRHI